MNTYLHHLATYCTTKHHEPIKTCEIYHVINIDQLDTTNGTTINSTYNVLMPGRISSELHLWRSDVVASSGSSSSRCVRCGKKCCHGPNNDIIIIISFKLEHSSFCVRLLAAACGRLIEPTRLQKLNLPRCRRVKQTRLKMSASSAATPSLI